MSTIPLEDVRALRRDKYGDDSDADMTEDLARLASGEPLAYVIGWIPFLGLRIHLSASAVGAEPQEKALEAARPRFTLSCGSAPTVSSRSTPALIPRPETEWWTKKLIAHLRERFGDAQFNLLDLCAGSGAIGLAVLKHLPSVHVIFVELVLEHAELIRGNIERNGLDTTRADIRSGDLFVPVADERFNIIATNPPYIPEGRELPRSVSQYEPPEALFAGPEGLAIIERISQEAAQHLASGGELWIECDVANAERTRDLLIENGAASAKLFPDQYGRPRLVVAYYP